MSLDEYIQMYEADYKEWKASYEQTTADNEMIGDLRYSATYFKSRYKRAEQMVNLLTELRMYRKLFEDLDEKKLSEMCNESLINLCKECARCEFNDTEGCCTELIYERYKRVLGGDK